MNNVLLQFYSYLKTMQSSLCFYTKGHNRNAKLFFFFKKKTKQKKTNAWSISFNMNINFPATGKYK